MRLCQFPVSAPNKSNNITPSHFYFDVSTVTIFLLVSFCTIMFIHGRFHKCHYCHYFLFRIAPWFLQGCLHCQISPWMFSLCWNRVRFRQHQKDNTNNRIYKSSAVAQMGDHGHNRHGPKREGVLCPFRGALGTRLIQCGLRGGLLLYQVASSSIQPFGHNSVGCHSTRRVGISVRTTT